MLTPCDANLAGAHKSIHPTMKNTITTDAHFTEDPEWLIRWRSRRAGGHSGRRIPGSSYTSYYTATEGFIPVPRIKPTCQYGALFEPRSAGFGKSEGPEKAHHFPGFPHPNRVTSR